MTEGKKTYCASNLANLELNSPWGEGVNGNGIGEKISFETNGEVLYFFNGYVSFSKPWLYTDNGRVKKIKISSKKVC